MMYGISGEENVFSSQARNILERMRISIQSNIRGPADVDAT
jgi:hypothetical protein